MDEQATAQAPPATDPVVADRMRKAREAKQAKADRKAAKAAGGGLAAIKDLLASVLDQRLSKFEERLSAVETMGTPSITVTTKEGAVLKTPGMAVKQTLPAREVRYPRPAVPEGQKAWWIECPNAHVAAWFSGPHPWHPCAPEVVDVVSEPEHFHRLKSGFDDRRTAIRGQLPPCTFCGACIPINAAATGSKVFNFNAKYLREGPPPDADEYGYPVR